MRHSGKQFHCGHHRRHTAATVHCDQQHEPRPECKHGLPGCAVRTFKHCDYRTRRAIRINEHAWRFVGDSQVRQRCFQFFGGDRFQFVGGDREQFGRLQRFISSGWGWTG